MDTDEFLRLLEIPAGSGRYVLCPFDPGITLLKQQTRALNLIFALSEAGKLATGSKVLVIGGGVAGITAAAGASKLGCKVTLLERLHTLLHLQTGCDTRWLHPHIYDWPASNSQRAYAELPVLDWRAGSASNVAKQILEEFSRLQRNAPEDSFHVFTGVSITELTGRKVSWENDVVRRTDTFGLVIFAVGFGIERNLNVRSLSYWRNDSLHQSDPRANPNFKTTCLISGTGDGGLIDLMRATISDFNHETVHRELFADSTAELSRRLLDIRDEWKGAAQPKQEGWLHDEYSSLLSMHLLDDVLEKIDRRRRKDMYVTLNGQKRTFHSVLSLDNASVFSTLVAFCLSTHAVFKYVGGQFSIEKGHPTLAGKRKKFDQVVIRHGADIEAAYKSVFCQDVIDIFGNGDRIRRYLKSASRLWPAGWWDADSANQEYVTRPTCLLATTFVSTLRDVVELAYQRHGPTPSSEQLEFRITIHRLTRIQGQDYYQQIARYAGTETRLKGKIGRVFPVTTGLGGLCCRIRKPVKIICNGAGFDELKQGLEIDHMGARPISDNVQSFLTVPFFTAPSHDEETTPMILLLYADSNREDFFSESVLETIYSACRGFVGHVEGMMKQNEITFSDADSSGFVGAITATDAQLVATHPNIIVTDNSIFKRYQKDLTFRKVQYFDVSHQA